MTEQSAGARWRSRAAEDTLSEILPQIENAGITRVSNITGLDTIGLPVVQAIRPNARSISVSLGKGATVAAAAVSAIMEGYELYQAEHIRAPLYSASALELTKVDLKLFDPLMRRSPDELAPQPLLWVEATDLITGGPAMVPHDLVSMDFSHQSQFGNSPFLRSSNGLASGNTEDEAIVHAVCEIIERDAMTLWHFSDDTYRSSMAIDQTALPDRLQELLAPIHDGGMQTNLHELTSEIAVPVFACEIGGGAHEPHRALAGFGCHPDPLWAAERAILEAAQSRLTMIAGSRDDLLKSQYGGRIHQTSSVAGTRPFPVSPSELPSDTNRSREYLIDRVKRLALDLIGVEMTGVFGLPVWRVIIPQLEPPCELSGYRLREDTLRRLSDSERIIS
ncbi:MAG: YcaO-like family protein [Pseudomonadota bacterium]